jgi:hypothetical protein
MARIDYLTEAERKRFEMTPEFTSSNERNYFFNLPNVIYSQAILLKSDEAIAEASNRFSKAVFFGNNAEFIFASQEEQIIANALSKMQLSFGTIFILIRK